MPEPQYTLKLARKICKADPSFRIESVFIRKYGKEWGEFDFKWCLQRRPEESTEWRYVAGSDPDRVRYSNGGTITKIWPEDRI